MTAAFGSPVAADGHLAAAGVAVAARDKADTSQLLNLRSNELLHPDVDALVGSLLAAMPSRAATRYPAYVPLVDRVARAWGLPAERVWLSAGSDAAIALACEALGGHGRLLLHTPSYPAWAVYAPLRGLDVVPLALDVRRPPRETAAELAAALAAQPPALVALSNPNGPTGYELDEAGVATICDAAAAAGHLVVLDACYEAFGVTRHAQFAARHDHVVVLHSFSKALGLAGARIAMVAGAPSIIAHLRRWRPEGPVSGTAIELLRGVLDAGETIEAACREVREVRSWFAAAVVASQRGWANVPSAGNFATFAVPSAAEAAAVAAGLKRRGIVVGTLEGIASLDAGVRLTIAGRATMERVLVELDALARPA